jgi:hypothetical protein
VNRSHSFEMRHRVSKKARPLKALQTSPGSALPEGSAELKARLGGWCQLRLGTETNLTQSRQPIQNEENGTPDFG